MCRPETTAFEMARECLLEAGKPDEIGSISHPTHARSAETGTTAGDFPANRDWTPDRMGCSQRERHEKGAVTADPSKS